MAERVVYRGPGGRFVSRAVALELGIEPTVFGGIPTGTGPDYAPPSYWEPEEEEAPPEPFWNETPQDRVILWDEFDAGSEQDLAPFAPPNGVDKYRVFLDVLDNPDYPRGMASTGWIDVDIWPPSLDMIRNVDAQGFNQIRFRRI